MKQLLLTFVSASMTIGVVGGAEPVQPTIVERGPHHRTVTHVTHTNDGAGQVIAMTNSYVELATGMHYWKDGEWVEAREEIEIAPHGAVATRGQHKVAFPANINTSGGIDLTAEDGKRFRSHVLGLAYTDAATLRSVLIGQLKDSVGELIAPNQIIYRDAFTDIHADIRYTYTRAGFEQDVILRVNPPSPQEYGLNPDTTRLEIYTEFLQPPSLAKKVRRVMREGHPSQRPAMAEPDLTDDELHFGAMQMRNGQAFSIERERARNQRGTPVPVAKLWQRIDDRDFLIEAVEYSVVREQLNLLPQTAAVRNPGIRGLLARKPTIGRRFPPAPILAQVNAKPIQTAEYRAQQPGFIVDYTLQNGTNITLQADTTYYVSGTVVLRGTNVIEGGTVVKFTNYNINVYLQFNDAVVCKTSPYRPAVFTSEDDNTVGAAIVGSTGVPSGYYASTALYNPSFTTGDLHHLTIKWAKNGINWWYTANRISDIQIINCEAGIHRYYTPAPIHNVLMRNVDTAFVGYSVTYDVQHATLHQCTNLAVIDGVYSQGLMRLTNCVITKMSSWGSYNELSGNYNALYQTPSLSQSTGYLLTALPYRTVGGGAHYLTANNICQDAGTTNINPALLAELRQKTTYPPIVFSNATISAQTTFGPQAGRDSGAPDLGYHYEPLDYAFGGSHGNTNLVFAAGTAVGWFRTVSGWTHAGHGLHMADRQIVTFDGRVDAPTYWVRCNVVQEGSTGLWDGGYGPGGITGWADQNLEDVTLAPEIRARFTKFSMLAGDGGNHCRDDNGYLILRARDCEFFSSAITGYVISSYLTNCLFDRVQVGQVAGLPGNEVHLRNCTLRGGLLVFDRGYTSPAIPVSAYECAFDGTSMSQDTYGNTDYNYNAFLSGGPYTTPTGPNDVVVSSFGWETGWLGRFYLPDSSTLLDAGSVTAPSRGLYHYTSTTNQTKEASSTINIGYHYIALNGLNKPNDADSDGVPDYLEDANGNGNVDSGETDWQSGGDAGLSIFITSPKAGSIVP